MGGFLNERIETTALSFVENSEAARYVFVVVVIGGVMVGGRRYDTFELAWRQAARGEKAAEFVFVTFRPTDMSRAYKSTCRLLRTKCETTPRLVVRRTIHVPSSIATSL